MKRRKFLSFDQGLPPTAQPEVVKIVKMARALQPDVMMRNRGIGRYADYANPEHWVPHGLADPRVAGIAWEAIDPLTTRWAYQPRDKIKSKEWLLATLWASALLSNGGRAATDSSSRFPTLSPRTAHASRPMPSRSRRNRTDRPTRSGIFILGQACRGRKGRPRRALGG